MPSPLSKDIRDRFTALHKEGHFARWIGCRLMISAATAVRYAATLRSGEELEPKPNPRRTGDGRLVPYEPFLPTWLSRIPTLR